ncbi:MAG TPA: dockerin type I domain-containing protein, partial [Methanoculleus sp.]|nr:dockerin type I domain-containing protein [Methanoculleus sp.]
LVFTTRSGYSVQMTAPHVKGDFNGNGRVDIGDVARVAWMAIGLTPVDMGADFNGDGKVDAADAAKIAYYYVGKIPSL